ncbi:OsmC family protein [Acidiplasma sp.]|uniref:OsmC family protein n=1 Tax=Acidiplasma sp. TaxID=1872114 RepID=UPI002584DF6D|nr:OsmC family protein [Acidiplasma sp.]
MVKIINNIDMEKLEQTSKKVHENGGHFGSEKHIKGEFHFEGSPMFTAELSSEKAKFILGADEPGVLGGQGTHATPLNYLMMGVMSCFASTVAIQAAKRGVRLNKLNFTGHLYYDIGPVVEDSNFPIIKSIKIDVESDEDIRDILIASRKACPALYAMINPIPTEIAQI